jgi:hypothetical protein
LDHTTEIWSERRQVDGPEPPCDDARGHDWSQRSVCGSGGGVVVVEVCDHCGVRRITDTWDQDPSTGEEGYRTRRYETEPEETR